MGERSGYLGLVACGLVWGSVGVIIDGVAISGAAIAFFRVALASLVVGVWVLARGRGASLRLGPRRGLVVGAAVVIAAHWAMMFEAFKRLDVATTILIVYLGPPLIALGAPAVLGERLERRSVGALAVAVAGVALITLPDAGRLDAAGVAYAAGAAVLFAAVVLMGKILTAHYPPPTIVVWQLGLAALLLAPWLAGAPAGAIRSALPALVALGVVHTGLAGILYFRSLGLVKAQHAGVIIYLEPAAAVLYAWIFLAEAPSALTLLGGALVVAAGLAIALGAPAEAAPSGMPEPTVERAR